MSSHRHESNGKFLESHSTSETDLADFLGFSRFTCDFYLALNPSVTWQSMEISSEAQSYLETVFFRERERQKLSCSSPSSSPLSPQVNLEKQTKPPLSLPSFAPSDSLGLASKSRRSRSRETRRKSNERTMERHAREIERRVTGEFEVNKHQLVSFVFDFVGI